MLSKVLSVGDKVELTRVQAAESYLKNIANVIEVKFAETKEEVPEDVMSAVIDGAEVFVPLDDLLDYKAEFERLTKEKAKLEGEVQRVVKMLANPGFVNKAPAAKIEQEKEKQAKYEDMLEKVIARLALVEKKL